MIGLPITWIIVGVIVLFSLLALFISYLAAARAIEERKRMRIADYLERTKRDWYIYLRGIDVSDSSLIPTNRAEVEAVEELFISYLNNVSGGGIEERIQAFANTRLAGQYKKQLRSRNGGERINTLHRIYDFEIDVLQSECRKLAARTRSPEEQFQLLMIDLRIEPKGFIARNLEDLKGIAEYESKILLFSMPANVFKEAFSMFEEFDAPTKYAFVDVIGMHHDPESLPFLESLLNSKDGELRIRALRAMDSLGIRIPERILARASKAEAWEERYLAARLLKSIPSKDAQAFAKTLAEDESWMVREEAMARGIGGMINESHT